MSGRATVNEEMFSETVRLLGFSGNGGKEESRKEKVDKEGIHG